MECIDLRTGFMMLSFRSQKEVERAKTLCESKGIGVACALAYDDITEEEANSFVKHVPHEGQNRFCNYINQSADGLCHTAKESLDTAIQHVESMNGCEGGYLLIYQKEAPLLKASEPVEAHA
ncbi:hypothetical protein [Pontibacter pamirensis]|uniref:hypothetical protein n=1 Tax=Pontibacter pamirensis TaxID=2562824 RepID=UPI00138A1365|nr:hypothetical protein [Pontibacter pamirensis]